MTTGTVTKNATYVFNNGEFSGAIVGHYWRAQWSGGDGVKQLVRAAPRPTSPPPMPAPEYRLVYSRRRRKWIRIRTNKPSPELVAAWQAYAAACAARRGLPKVPRKKPVRAPNNYSKTVTSYDADVYRFGKSSNPLAKMAVQVNNIYGWTDTHLPIDAGQEYKLIAKLRRKAYGSGFHPGIFAAEMPKALKMIGDSALKLRRGLLHAALGNWRGVIRNLGRPTDVATKTISKAFIGYREGQLTLSGLWLELQYGWRPLLGDLEAGSAFIAEQLVGGAAALSRRVCGTRNIHSEANYSSTNVMYYRHKVTVTRLRYVITNLEASPVTGLPSLASVAAVPWELLPYSFVCDWVVPISDYLAALRTASDLKGTVVRSCKQTTTFSDVAVNRGTWDIGPIPLSGSGETREIMTFTRQVSSEIKPPLPIQDLSPGSIITSLTRAANAVALLKDLRFNPGDRTGIRKLLRL